MELFLHNNVDSDVVINKNIGQGFKIDINLKADTDIINPIIVLQSLPDVDYQDYNYAHIPELKRFYFINKINSINAKLWRLELQSDVIESFKADILASNARLRRNIRNGDYFNAHVDSSIVKTVNTYPSDVALNDSDSSIILTTVGV